MLTTTDRMEAYSSVQGLCLYLSSKEKATNNSYDGSCQALCQMPWSVTGNICFGAPNP